ncbi:MAG: hypothetical protein IH820_12585 [Bacteroidetes bacterium]|nr:hypothetical protein [Bacteroidota bacterium]
MNDYVDTNRALWEGWTKLHTASAFYDVDGFKAGHSTLKPVERDELGDVSGKTLLHLQCHFGLDTLSWAHEGTVVTGKGTHTRENTYTVAIPARITGSVCASPLNDLR